MLLEWITLQRSKNLECQGNLFKGIPGYMYAEEKAASKGQLNDFRAS